jgi:hypothetical protein
VRCVSKAFEKHISGDIQGGIQENTTIPIENRPDQFSSLRPDMWFIRKEGNQQILEILEFGCPFGHIEAGEGESTLKLTYDYKLNKYQPLADKYIYIYIYRIQDIKLEYILLLALH